MVKRWVLACSWIVLAACASTPAPTGSAQAEILGDWEMATQYQGQTIDAVMSLSEVNGVLNGRWSSQGREMVLMDLAFDGKRLTFRRDMGTVLDFAGTVDGDEINGVYTGPFGELPCTGHRAVDR
ncbi:MAG: hypothetical protein GY715_07630 [Planctomycetes bacterium]|nr:hypothetical protein [Planctomycetota bacterium]